MNTEKLTQKDKELVIEYSEYLDRLKVSSLKKFIKGRLEHNDQNPLTIDCDSEIMEELIDINAYIFLKVKQYELTRNT